MSAESAHVRPSRPRPAGLALGQRDGAVRGVRRQHPLGRLGLGA